MKKVLGGVVLFGVLVCAAIAESITFTYEAEAKVPPVVTLIQNEPVYFENAEIVGSENSINIEKFTNPPLRSGDDVQTTTTNNKEKNTTSSSVVPAAQRLTKSRGVFPGPSGKETWYSLDMSGVIRIMRSMGYDEELYPYTLDEDGIKRFGGYVMVAANLELRPKGTIVDTSWGEGIVVDTGSFCKKDTTAIDIAVDAKKFK